MPYQVLARKYRPQTFEDVIGQEHVTRTLKNAIAQQRIAHGYIFSGHRGIGKTTVARILAMCLNCRGADGKGQQPQPEPCGKCDSCQEIRAGNSVDVIEIDAATNRGIDEIRELREGARYRPARDRYKIYILDEAHQITDAAFNALLKTLEEPPPHIVFMMATTQPEDIPQTIRSRCQHFSFHAVRFDEIVSQLRDIAKQEKISAEPEAIALLAEAGDGSMRDALSIMDQAIASSEGKLTKDAVLALVGVAPGEVLEAIMQAIENNSSEEVLRTVDRLMAEGQSPVHFSRQMIRFLRNAIVAKVAGGESQLLQISADERARVARVAERFSEEDLTRFLQILLRAYNDISYRADQRFHLELALLKLVHAQRLLPVEELLSGMQSQAGRSVKPSPRPAATPSTSSGAAAGSQSVAPAVPRSEVSPFEKDRARKNEMSAAPVAVMEATAEPQNSPANDFELVTRVSSAVIAALEDQGHRQLAAILAGGNWEVAGAEAIVRVATPASLLELALSTEAKKIAASAASTAAARNLRLRAEAVAATNGSATSNQPMRHSAGAPAGGRQRAIDDPLVRKVQEKFGAEIRTVIDYREKQRPKS